MSNTIKYIKQGIKYKTEHKQLRTGGTCDARYCYSIWMRHLINYYNLRQDIPQKVVEFGPGDTIGIGLMALLCGAEVYYALDFTRYAGMNRIEHILEQLIYMLKERRGIPGSRVYPNVYPKLTSYQFPKNILTDAWLNQCLAEERIERIKTAVREVKQGGQSEMIHYLAPWWEQDVLQVTCDFVYSQAVFEHIDDYKSAHKVIGSILKPGGVVSHEIDFSCHGCADNWNGYWAYNKFIWKLVYGTRPYFLNRIPLSCHIHEMQKNGIRIEKCIRTKGEGGIQRNELSKEFRRINHRDLQTRNAYVIGYKKGKRLSFWDCEQK